MIKRVLISIVILLILIAGVIFLKNKLTPPAKVVHYHAGFQVYVDGKLQDFSDIKYMHVKPCTNHKEKEEHEDEQEEKAHLHDGIRDVVHVHRDNATWRDLFINIHYSFNSSQSAESYVNGKRVLDILNQKINPYDSLVLLLGKHGNVKDYIKNKVTKEHIQKTEKRSESCGT